MPEDGSRRAFSLTGRLREQGHALPVVLVGDRIPAAAAVQAIREGAIDVLVRPFEPTALLRSVARATALMRVLGVPTDLPGGLAGMLEALTPRERDVLALLVRGLPTKVIGLELGISPRTAEIHRRRILRKMQADNVVQLTRLILLAGHGLAAPLLAEALPPTATAIPAAQG